MKAAIKNTRLYKALRFRSWVLRLTNPDVYLNMMLELVFYRNLVQHFGVEHVFDIGANIGFTAEALLKGGAREVIAVEPDAYNYSILDGKLGRDSRATLVNMAVDIDEGKALLRRHSSDGALHTLSPKYAELNALRGGEQAVHTTTLDALIQRYGCPDYVKIDVEGHEPAVLEGLSQTIRLVSFECNLPDFKAEGQACVAHLAKLSSSYVFNYAVGTQWQFADWVTVAEFQSILEAEERTVCWECFAWERFNPSYP